MLWLAELRLGDPGSTSASITDFRISGKLLHLLVAFISHR